MEIVHILQDILDRNIFPPIMNLFGNGGNMKSCSWEKIKRKRKERKIKK
jgi:hypothetical protein